MGVVFSNESPQYCAARDELLTREIELRRAMESVAVARRALPPGGLLQQHYVFDELDAAAPFVGAHANMVVVAEAPIKRLATFGRERGWRHIRVLSSGRNSFARDYNGEIDGMQMPMMNVFSARRRFHSALLGSRDALRARRPEPGSSQYRPHRDHLEPLRFDATRAGHRLA